MARLLPKPGRSLADKHPDVAQRWSVKNGGLTAADVGYGSKLQAWWRCDGDQNHPDYQRRIDSVTSGGGCPLCGHAERAKKQAMPEPGESLADYYPALAEQWNAANELTAFDVMPASGQKRQWICPRCQHEWSATPKSRTVGGTGCPKCAIRAKGEALQKR